MANFPLTPTSYSTALSCIALHCILLYSALIYCALLCSHLLFSHQLCSTPPYPTLPCPTLRSPTLPYPTQQYAILCSHLLSFTVLIFSPLLPFTALLSAFLYFPLFCSVLRRGGFSGFAETSGYEPIELTLETVADIHHSGGNEQCLLEY